MLALYVAIEYTEELQLLDTQEDMNIQYDIVERLLVAGANPNITIILPPPPPQAEAVEEGATSNEATGNNVTNNPNNPLMKTIPQTTKNPINLNNKPPIKNDVKKDTTKNNPKIEIKDDKNTAITQSGDTGSTTTTPTDEKTEETNNEVKKTLLDEVKEQIGDIEDDGHIEITLLQLVCEKQLSDIVSSVIHYYNFFIVIEIVFFTLYS